MEETTLRAGREVDADPAAALLRRSISELCVADHANDPDTLRAWLGNKTPERFRAWVRASDRYVVVAERGGTLCGVGMIGADGVIRLCYVLPELVSRGVGRALLEALEAKARAWGLGTLTLSSTRGARKFYERAGYCAAGRAVPGFGVTHCHPYAKELSSDA